MSSTTDTQHRFDSLPNEILIEIFLACVEAIDLQFVLDPKFAPWVLVLVCQRWRKVGLSTPCLWTRLPPISVKTQLQSSPFSPKLLTRALTLSSTEPLNISLTLTYETVFSYPLLEIVIPHLNRCKTLNLMLNDDILAQFENHYWDLPFLEELDVFVQSPLPNALSMSRFFDISHNTPRLSRLCAYFPNGIETGVTLSTYLRIGWSRLTHLTLGCVSFRDVYHILENTPLLQVFRLRTPEGHGLGHIPRGPVIRLNYLTTLVFDYFNPLGIPSPFEEALPAQFLDCLNLPSISTLLSNHTGECDTYISFVRRSRCSITNLRAALAHSPPEKIIELLEVMPTIHVLEVLMDDLPILLHSMELFFSRSIHSSIILPSLQHLKLLTRTVKRIPHDLRDTLDQFIHSRTEDRLSCALGDHASGKLQLLERVSLYLPTPAITAQVLWDLTGQSGKVNCHLLDFVESVWEIASYMVPRGLVFEDVKANLEGLFLAKEGVVDYDLKICAGLKNVASQIAHIISWLPQRFPEHPEAKAMAERLQGLVQRWSVDIPHPSQCWVYVADKGMGALTYSTGY